ncbi:DUF4149 domain-containing protein [Candidatus Nitrospira bockiana]
MRTGRDWRLVWYSMELIALSLWIGGLVVIVAAVIPAVFNSFGMEPGGRFLTRAFDGYNRVVLTAAGLLLVSAVVRHLAADGVLERLSRTEAVLSVLMVMIATTIIFVLEPASVRLQEQAFAVKEEAARKAAYDAFFRSHTLVRVLYLANLALGVALIPVKLKAWLRARKEVV